MKKGHKIKGLLAIVVAMFAGGTLSADAADCPVTWPPATESSKPWVYNWWMGSAVDAAGLERQCAELEDAGFGGFHVIPIYEAKGWESKTRRFLSSDWMSAFAEAVRIGREHGLGVDLTMGCGWCFGGPQIKPEQGCWKLARTSEGQPPYVTWELTGQQVKRAGPGGQGLMMDPFSKVAMRTFLEPFTAAFDAADAVRPRCVYHDSWEYFSAGWSPELFAAFRNRRGYDLRDHLKELSGLGDRELVSRVRLDYRETLSDIVIEETFPLWVRWAHERGVLTRNEAHGTCANWLDFYQLADIPETEMFAEECRDVLVSKFASSAAHVSGKRLVSSESCTWMKEHFTETLEDFKVFVDRLFLSGVNHIYYHGYCYSPIEAVWPGWCFYASSEMNGRNPIWRDVKYLNAYVSRCQSVFQSCEPDNDTLLYWPVRDYWAEADGFETMMSVHNATNWFHAQPIGRIARELSADGCAFDYVSDRQLQALDLSRYRELVVPPCKYMPEATKAAVARFRGRGSCREPFTQAGLSFVRFRHGDDRVYFLVNTNGMRKTGRFLPSCGRGRAWLMNPMTGGIDETAMDEHGVEISLESFASVILVVRPGMVASARVRSDSNDVCTKVKIDGPWTLTPVCGGPEMPLPRQMNALTTWSRNPDGSENPFAGTMRYRTVFSLAAVPDSLVLDIGEVRDSAVVRINGRDAGFSFMRPHRVEVPVALLREGENELEIDVTSVGANRIRWNDRTGVNWKYFKDANVVAYGYTGPFNASKWPLRDCGLLGPVMLMVKEKRVDSSHGVAKPCGERVTDFNFSDPTIWQASDGRYLALASGMDRLLVSDDLFHWRDAGFPIVTPETYARLSSETIGDRDWTAGKGLWAPDVTKVGTNWILTVTLRKSYKDSRIVSLVADAPEGPFRDPRLLTSGLQTRIGDSIDPEVVRDGDRTFLFFGSVGGIHCLELAVDARSPLPGAKPVHVAGLKADFDMKGFQPGRHDMYEGSYVFHRNGWWYLFASGGYYRDWTYRIVVGRSKSVLGPYVDRKGRPMTEGHSETILRSGEHDRFFGPGHNGEIVERDGKSWMSFHVHDREIPYEGSYIPRPMMVQELRWDAEGWPFFAHSK